jgi:Spx/MgsR family transcriptional regulator
MAAATITFYQKPTCTTCRKAKARLQELKIDFASHDLDKERLSETELDHLIGDRDYKGFLNTRNEMYRKLQMGEHMPSRAEALKLMAKEPNLIRRPLLVSGSQIVVGFDQAAYRKLAKS